MSNALFIFRRDLRLYDNTALNKAFEKYDNVIPIFILDPRQIENNQYKSEFGLIFMINSLIELDRELRLRNSKLNIFYGLPEKILENIYKKYKFEAIYLNEDYTPFSIERDKKIKEFADKNNIEFYSYTDYLLYENKSDFKFKNFTHFYNHASKYLVRNPYTNIKDFIKIDSLDINFLNKYKTKESKFLKGGRKEALILLKRKFDYKRKDYPYENNTSLLSAHIKFGTVSIREVYYNFKENKSFIRQLYWRDFYTLLAYNNSYVFERNYKNIEIEWENNEEYFNKWKEGKTGYPIVDAGMRQLNDIGYLPNRVRMLSAFLLTKILFIDWRWGEKYFANKLIDYDPSLNNGNWQWVASTGTDYTFRIFDIWKQQKRYDKECKYIKEWVTELKKYDPYIIHNLEKIIIKDYPEPLFRDWRDRLKYVREKYYKNIK